MEHTPRNNYKKITGLRLECCRSGIWGFTTEYTRWLEDGYKELIEALINTAKFMTDMGYMPVEENSVIKIIEKRTDKTWEEINA